MLEIKKRVVSGYQQPGGGDGRRLGGGAEGDVEVIEAPRSGPGPRWRGRCLWTSTTTAIDCGQTTETKGKGFWRQKATVIDCSPKQITQQKFSGFL